MSAFLKGSFRHSCCLFYFSSSLTVFFFTFIDCRSYFSLFSSLFLSSEWWRSYLFLFIAQQQHTFAEEKKTVITSLFNKLTPFFPFCCLRKKSPGCSRAFLMEGCAKLRHFFFLRLLLVDTHTRKKDYLSRLFEKLVMPAVVCVDCAPQKQNV